LVAVSGVDTLPVQAGAVPVHSGSPPPVSVAVLFNGPSAAALMATGTVMTMLPMTAPAAIVQPARVLAPIAVGAMQVIAPPVAVGNALSVTPAGKTSASVMLDKVALPATLMLIRYDCPACPMTNGV
jgi:hypothetical protein